MNNSEHPPAGPPKRHIWNDPRVRAVAFQIVALLAVFWMGWTLVDNTLANMAARGINTGFDFLDLPADFGILFTLIPYNPSMSYLRVFWVGIVNTLMVSAIGIVLATILGFIIGIARLSGNWLVAKLAQAYIEIFRNIPLLLQIFFWYFFVIRSLPSVSQSISIGGLFFLNNRGIYMPRPDAEAGFQFVLLAIIVAIAWLVIWSRFVRWQQNRTGRRLPVFWPNVIVFLGLPLVVFLLLGAPLHWSVPILKAFNFAGGMTVLPEFGALLFALTMYTAAFIAEAVRSGILSVSKGQTEAAQALGLRPRRTLRLIVIPQAMRVIIPQLTSQYLNLTKNSSLATAIGYPDLVALFMGTTLNQTGQAVEVIAMTMAVYLVISLLISLGMNIYNRAVSLQEGRA